MDPDPELDITLSDGRTAVTYQITAADEAEDTWVIVEPLAPLRVVGERAQALAGRAAFDVCIAARLAAGWVPLEDPRAARVAPVPFSEDLQLRIGSAVEALVAGRVAVRAADPTGHLWAACARFISQARAVGLGAPGTRSARSRRKRRLGELAEQVGDLGAALVHYRAALAADPRVGVRAQVVRTVPAPRRDPDRDRPRESSDESCRG